MLSQSYSLILIYVGLFKYYLVNDVNIFDFSLPDNLLCNVIFIIFFLGTMGIFLLKLKY